jgi:hypothetical protein
LRVRAFVGGERGIIEEHEPSKNDARAFAELFGDCAQSNRRRVVDGAALTIASVSWSTMLPFTSSILPLIAPTYAPSAPP